MSNNELVSYREEMAQRAKESRAVEIPSVNKISFFNGKNGWCLKADDQEIGTTILCYILANRRVNAWYANIYNPDVQEAPDCWSVFEKKYEHVAAPDERCSNPQSDRCATCPKNAFGSARNGRGGKDCGNRRRLALLPAGGFDPKSNQWVYSNAEQLEAASIYSTSIPPTSDKNFKEFIRSCDSVYGRSTDGVIATMVIVPSNKSMFQIEFKNIIAPDDEDILNVLREKWGQAEMSIDYGFEVSTEKSAEQSQSKTNKF